MVRTKPGLEVTSHQVMLFLCITSRRNSDVAENVCNHSGRDRAPAREDVPPPHWRLPASTHPLMGCRVALGLRSGRSAGRPKARAWPGGAWVRPESEPGGGSSRGQLTQPGSCCLCPLGGPAAWGPLCRLPLSPLGRTQCFSTRPDPPANSTLRAHRGPLLWTLGLQPGTNKELTFLWGRKMTDINESPMLWERRQGDRKDTWRG